MPITLQIPSPLRPDCGGQAELTIDAATVGEVLKTIEQVYPKLYRSVCDETGAMRRHVQLFVNDSLVSTGTPGDTKLAAGDVLFITPAVSGG